MSNWWEAKFNIFYCGTKGHVGNEPVQRVWWEAKFKLFDYFVEYSRNMLVLRGKAGMSGRSERLVGGKIHSFFYVFYTFHENLEC